MYCPYCTAWNEDDAKVCGYCKRDLTIGAAPTEPSGESQTGEPPPASPPLYRHSTIPPPPPFPADGEPTPPPAKPFHSPPPTTEQAPYGMPPGALTTSPGMPAPGWGRRPSPKHSVKASWSLGLGVAGIICSCAGIVFGIPGLLLGIAAHRECSRHPDRFIGKGFAIAGIITSCIALISFLTWVVYFAVVFPGQWEEIQQEMIQMEPGFVPGAGSPYASDAAIIVRIIPAIESYMEAHGEWPAWGAGPLGANGHVSPYDPAYHMPTFRVWRSPAERGTFATLTTPIAYLAGYPPDLNSAVVSGTATYGYYTNGTGWIVYSPGPDGIYDIDPLTMYPAGEFAIETYQALWSRQYDPTNGAISGGDILFMWEDY